MVLDEQKILEEIQKASSNILAVEEGAGLVDEWIARCAEIDSRDETLAVETGFYIEPAPLTFVVGTQDRVFRDHKSRFVCGSEWKSTKHRTKMWTPEAWVESISNGHQVATYAAGLKYGVMLGETAFSWLPQDFPAEGVEVLVRAVSKSHPPEIWPKAEGYRVFVSEERMKAVLNAYTVTAEGIRGMRRSGLVPWQVPGLQCVNQFRKECPLLESCRKGTYPEGNGDLSVLPQSFSPGSQRVVQRLMELGRITVDNVKDVVILSASTLSQYQQCPELWRRESLRGEEEQGENEYMEIGTVLHAGLAEVYRQMKEGRKGE